MSSVTSVTFIRSLEDFVRWGFFSEAAGATRRGSVLSLERVCEFSVWLEERSCTRLWRAHTADMLWGVKQIRLSAWSSVNSFWRRNRSGGWTDPRSACVQWVSVRNPSCVWSSSWKYLMRRVCFHLRDVIYYFKIYINRVSSVLLFLTCSFFFLFFSHQLSIFLYSCRPTSFHDPRLPSLNTGAFCRVNCTTSSRRLTAPWRSNSHV